MKWHFEQSSQPLVSVHVCVYMYLREVLGVSLYCHPSPTCPSLALGVLSGSLLLWVPAAPKSTGHSSCALFVHLPAPTLCHSSHMGIHLPSLGHTDLDSDSQAFPFLKGLRSPGHPCSFPDDSSVSLKPNSSHRSPWPSTCPFHLLIRLWRLLVMALWPSE